MDFGFLPYISGEAQKNEWCIISKHLGFSSLDIRYST